jgi:hypothetical protein
MQMSAQRSAEKRQEKIAQAMDAYRASKAQEGRAAIDQFVGGIQPEAKAQEAGNIQSELEQGLADSVGAVRKFEAPQAIAGKVSEDFTGRSESNAADWGERIKRAVGQLSQIGLPGEAQFREARRYGRAASDVDSSNSAANNVSGYYQNAIQNVRPNPYLTYGAQVVSGLGMGVANNMAKKPPATTSVGGFQVTPGGNVALA